MNEVTRKWKDKHHRCRNCKYLRSANEMWHKECVITGALMHLDDIYNSFLPPGIFCRYYKTRIEDDLNG